MCDFNEFGAYKSGFVTELLGSSIQCNGDGLVVFFQAKDILDAILENYPKSKKDLYVSTLYIPYSATPCGKQPLKAPRKTSIKYLILKATGKL